MKIKIFSIFLLLSLTSCMGGKTVPVSQLSSHTLANNAKVEGKSSFDKSLVVYTPYVGNMWREYTLRGFVNKKDGNVSVIQVYITLNYSKNWRFYERADTDDGQSKSLTVIKRDFDCSQYGCSYNEVVALNLSKDYLLSKKDSGFKFRIVNRNSSYPLVFEVPSNVIQGLIIALGNNGAKEFIGKL